MFAYIHIHTYTHQYIEYIISFKSYLIDIHQLILLALIPITLGMPFRAWAVGASVDPGFWLFELGKCHFVMRCNPLNFNAEHSFFVLLVCFKCIDSVGESRIAMIWYDLLVFTSKNNRLHVNRSTILDDSMNSIHPNS